MLSLDGEHVKKNYIKIEYQRAQLFYMNITQRAVELTLLLKKIDIKLSLCNSFLKGFERPHTINSKRPPSSRDLGGKFKFIFIFFLKKWKNLLKSK